MNWYRIAQATDINIQLNPIEQKIFSFLKQVKSLDPLLSQVSMRCVGGWCRDKLMGKLSKDIDIAVSSITGLNFAQKIQQVAQKHGIQGIGNIHSTALDKTGTGSSDLQVAALKIFGELILIVNLRTLVYDQSSRVPKQTITNNPALDAKRRDLSINSLYYNIETGRVLDYIGGLNDFSKGPDGKLTPSVLRTPADPVKTFMDDPLRMLRVLRFKARYPNAKVDEGIISAMSNPLVQNQYIKLSPERASKLIMGIMSGQDPVTPSRLLLLTGLYKKVFQIDDKWHPISMDQQNPFHDNSLLEHTLLVMHHYNQIAKERGQTGDLRGLMMLSTLLHDFGKMHPNIRQSKLDKKTGIPTTFDRNGVPVLRKTYIGHLNESATFALQIMKKMGFDKPQRDFVKTVTKFHMLPHALDLRPENKNFGKFLNQTGQRWLDVMYHGLADTLGKGLKDAAVKAKRRQTLLQLRQYKLQMGDLVHKPIIDGNKIRLIALISSPGVTTKYPSIMSDLVNGLKLQQWGHRVKTPLDAQRFIHGQTKNLLNNYKQLITKV